MMRLKSAGPWREMGLVWRGWLVSACITAIAQGTAVTAGSATSDNSSRSLTTSIEVQAQLEAARAMERAAYAADRTEDYQKAADAMEPAVLSNPADVSLRKSLGYLYMAKLNRPEQAILHLESATSISPDDVGAAQMLAEAYVRVNRPEDAIGVYSRLIEAHPNDVWSRIAIAKLRAKQRRHAEADATFREAVRRDPHDEKVALTYAEYLGSRGRRRESETIVAAVLRQHPDSVWGHSMMGDLARAVEDFDRARQAYAKALGLNPNWLPSTLGLRELDEAKTPTIDSVFFRFTDSNDLEQAGDFNSFRVFQTDSLVWRANVNYRWFRTPSVGTIGRFEEGLGLEYRPGTGISTQVGVSSFQTEGQSIEVGATASVLWKQEQFYLNGYGQFNDPVNESIVTVQRGFTQNILGGSGGIRIVDNFWLSAIGSIAHYSDGNDRRYLNAELAYHVGTPIPVQLALQYELIDFAENRLAYSSPHEYQTIRPLMELKPQITSGLQLVGRLELPYVVGESDWGAGITLGAEVTLNDRVALRASYFRQEIPGSFNVYDGDGFKVGLTWAMVDASGRDRRAK